MTTMVTTVHRASVAVAGDWHGNTAWATYAVEQVAASGNDVILHLGDFGIWPGQEGASFLRKVEAACRKHGVTILVTPGNHEDWDRIDRRDAVDRGDGWGAVKWFTDHVGVLPRGHRFAIEGSGGVVRRFVSVGGAPSIDLQERVIGRSWWVQEAITPDDVERISADGVADYMLCHDTPEPCVPTVERIVIFNPGGWSREAREYCNEGRRRLTSIFNAVRPSVLFHGHYHLRETDTVLGDADGEPFTCRIESLGMDGEPDGITWGHSGYQHRAGNVVVLDVATGGVEALAL